MLFRFTLENKARKMAHTGGSRTTLHKTNPIRYYLLTNLLKCNSLYFSNHCIASNLIKLTCVIEYKALVVKKYILYVKKQYK